MQKRLPPTCKINAVNMQHNFICILLIYVNMKHKLPSDISSPDFINSSIRWNTIQENGNCGLYNWPLNPLSSTWKFVKFSWSRTWSKAYFSHWNMPSHRSGCHVALTFVLKKSKLLFVSIKHKRTAKFWAILSSVHFWSDCLQQNVHVNQPMNIHFTQWLNLLIWKRYSYYTYLTWTFQLFVPNLNPLLL